ncbi:MAG: hypothetical protein JSU04_12505 [Bdellovibrionales bacterium]|nr:hypothetical protein [Bdellovibrionales bacterium]
MGIHKLNSSVATVIVGLTIITFGFQNCTKARFVIDEAAKQKALGDGSVFGTTPGDDGQIAGGGNTPGDDGNTPGSRPGDDGSVPGGMNPGNDGSMPKFPGMGNDPNMPKFPGMGNDPNMPGMPTTGNDPSMPRMPSVPGMPTTGDDTAVPGDGTAITVVPNPVCGPSITSGQASLPTSSKVVAVLFKSDNFSAGGATVIQAWDAEPDVTNIRTQLASLKPLSLKLSKTLAAGTYSVVMFDASKVKAPYKYDWSAGQNVIAPLQDSIAHFVDMNSTFKVDSSGKQKAVQSMNLLVGKQGDAACATAGSIDPLLIQLKTSTPQPIALSAPEDGVMFDLLGNRLNHKKVQTAWFESSKTENYYLVLPNKDGLVLGIDQLFGDATLGPDGKYASHGFAALAKYDDSGDKVISEDDEVFSQLRLWKDDNLDGIAQQSELYTLEEKGVVAIDLRFDKRYRETDKHGNVTKYKSVVVMKDGQYGLVYDLYLRYINK